MRCDIYELCTFSFMFDVYEVVIKSSLCGCMNFSSSCFRTAWAELLKGLPSVLVIKSTGHFDLCFNYLPVDPASCYQSALLLTKIRNENKP